MNHDKTSHQDPGFFENFFSHCSCIGGRKPEDYHSDMGSRKDLLRHQLQEDPEYYNSLSSNNQEWEDLEQPNQYYDNNGDLNHAPNVGTHDNFETIEPIDFDYLKQITGENKEADDADKSITSGLSKDSKKISKSKKSTKDASTNKEAKPKGAKGKRNPWQPHEDARLLELVEKHGQSWSLLSSMMEGRTGKQIRDRYLNILKPNIKKGDWTPYEDQQILALYYQFGHKWSKIASFVPSRTEGQVKNRFYSHIKKKVLGGAEGEGEPIAQVPPQQLQHMASGGSQGDRPQLQHMGSGGSQGFRPDFSRGHSGNSITPTHYNPSPSLYNYSPTSSQAPYNYANPNTQPSFFHPADDMISYQNGGNPADQGAYIQNQPQQQYDSSPMSEGSTGTHATTPYNHSGVKNERDVDNILGRLAGFYQTGANESPDMGFGDTADAVSKMDKVEQLKSRQKTLEYLLAQTLREMNTFGGQK